MTFRSTDGETFFEVVSKTTDTVTLTWIGTPGATSYIVKRDGSQVGTTNSSTYTYADSGLTASTTYTYQVIAVNNNIESSAQSVSATTKSGQQEYNPSAGDVDLSGMSAWGINITDAQKQESVPNQRRKRHWEICFRGWQRCALLHRNHFGLLHFL